jgi:hypothetical protein
MGTRNLPGGEGRLVHKADNLTTICLENMGALTSHNPMGLHGMLHGYLFSLFISDIFNSSDYKN